MKQLSLLLVFLSFNFNAHSQLFDPTKDWLQLDDFFLDEIIKERGIVAIRLEQREKRDDQIFRDVGERWLFEFNASGRVTFASKKTPMSNGYNTSWVSLKYDRSKRLIERIEHYGPFEFEYHYHYPTDSTYYSMKLNRDSSGADTLYYRKHRLEKMEDQLVEIVENHKGIPFLKEIEQLNEQGATLTLTLKYLFSRNQIKTDYCYEEGRLIEMHYQKYFGFKKDYLKTFLYDRDLLDEVKLFHDGILYERMRFTFRDGLPRDLIIRNYADKQIKIYRIEYDFY